MFNLPLHAGWMSANQNLPTAVLIDGENIAASDFPRLQTILNSIAGIGITRVFGDFSNLAHSEWLEICRDHGPEPILHCSKVTGKNGTDILMTIAAMDILAGGKFRRIVLVSGDGDFLALVRRLRADGMEVVGIGRDSVRTAVSGLYSCWHALFDVRVPHQATPRTQQINATTPKPPVAFRKAVLKIIKCNAQSLAKLGQMLRQTDEAFAKHLGNGKLKKYVKSEAALELQGEIVRLKAA